MSDKALASPIGHVRLFFENENESKIPGSLSAVEQIGESLWLAGDESQSVERLTSNDEANFKNHQSFDLASYFQLPVPQGQEIDLEALSWDKRNERLWIVGSHSLRRKQPKPGDSVERAFERLSDVDRQANRYLLGSIKLTRVSEADGYWQPQADTGQALQFDDNSSSLIASLETNALLSAFLKIPSKDNGFDIEGCVVRNDQALIGLRGPVLRGWASILRFSFSGAQGKTITPQPVNGQPYLHHLLDPDGLGVRDLCMLEDDVLILAGPTMSLDGPIRMFRWRTPFAWEKNTCIDGTHLERLFDVPWGDRVDHAEGLTVFESKDKAPRLLVVYDSPGKGRLHDGKYFEADLFTIP